MKLLSVVVPCYNSQEYMRHCVATLLSGGEAVEILIVNDGSVDDTAKIADELQAAYPSIVRAIHQENAGHGGAVMTGLHAAKGRYFKVVDSDDWVDEHALCKVLEKLRAIEDIDMLLCNFVYDKVGAKHKTVMQYRNVFPQDKIITWKDIGRFRVGQYILMHSVIYRTALLRECKLDLPRHTFYVDNLYVYLPLMHVKTLLYMDVTLYHYFIGREDQSVNERVMIGRIDQQLYVNRLMLERVNLQEVQPAKLQRYMRNYMEIVTVVSSVLLYRAGTPESLAEKSTLWRYIRSAAPWFDTQLRCKTVMGYILKHEGAFWRKISIVIYGVSRRVVGFN